MRAPTLRLLVQVLALNSVLVLGHPGWALVDAPLPRSLLINAVVFLVPGIPLADIARHRRFLQTVNVFWIMLGSLLTFVAVLLLTHALTQVATAAILWNGIWAATNAFILINLRLGGVQGAGAWFHRSQIATVAVFMAAYGVFFLGATRVVPILGDQDDELQGTAHGLIVHLAPSLPTSRNTEYDFAHPPLAHLYVAQVLTYHGLLNALAVYDSKTPGHLVPASAWAQFREHPYLLETRTPSIFLSATTVALFAMWIGRLAAGTVFGVLCAFVYASLPEVFVRSVYAGYFAISGFIALQILMSSEQYDGDGSRDNRRWCFVAGMFAALADHKLAVLPLSLVLWQSLRDHNRSIPQPLWQRIHPVAAGFLVGTAAFWSYGLAISPHDFWMDHVRHHLLDRIVHYNARGLDMSQYPGVPALWFEFWRDTSFVLIPGGVLALLMLNFRNATEADSSQSPIRGWHTTSGMLLIWVAITAVIFSLVDWRQSKHLALLALPLIVAFARFVHSRSPALRTWAAVFVTALLLWNVQMLIGLYRNFSGLVKLPEW